MMEAYLWGKVAAAVVEGLGVDVAAPDWLGGDNVVQRREWLFDWGTDRGRLITHLKTKKSQFSK